MAIIVKYTKAQYQAKIQELETHYNNLTTHLTRMEELKKSMFDFWDDPNAQTAGQVLMIQIRSVRSAVDRTSDTLAFYRSAVEKLEGSNLSVSGMLGDALGILGSLGL